MLTPTRAVQAYVGMWNATDDRERRALAEEALTDDVDLVYPTFEAHSRDDVVALARKFHSDTPGVRIAMLSGVEQHHGWVRVAWSMVLADGSAAGDGQTISEQSDDGRLRRVTGFRNPLPTVLPARPSEMHLETASVRRRRGASARSRGSD
jgi:hypothetical protein